MTRSLRWGVIGSGGIARRRTIPEGILPASNAELVSVLGKIPESNKEVARQFGAEAADSLEAFLETDIDAVYIASPVDVHFEQVIACAHAGKHVLCEKPLGMNPAQAQEMAGICDAAGVQLGCALMMRFLAQHQAALKLVRDGKLGTPTYGRAQLSCWYPPMAGAWRQIPALGGGGSLIDMGGHCIDLLEMFFGLVKTVSCFTNSTTHDYASEDSALAMLVFENGALGSVDAFFCIPDNSSKNVLELYGSKGSILAKGTIGQGEAGEMTAYLEEDAGEYNAQQARDASGGISIAPEPVNMYRAEIEGFSQAVLEGTPLPVDAFAGIRSQKIITACYESARTKRAVDIR